MTSSTLRWLAPLALGTAVYVAALPVALPAFAQGKPGAAGQAGQQKDLIARGQQLFDDQQYEESIQTLSGALVRPNNTKQQKIDIYRLLALNYITLNRKDEAESAVRGLLAIEPSYELPKGESPRFRDFFASVRQKWESEGKPGLITSEAKEPKPVTLQHNSPSQVAPETEIPLMTKLDDPDKRVTSIELHYRTGSSGKFTEVDMKLDPEQSTARANIPPKTVMPPFVEYYMLAKDKSGLPVGSRGDSDAPLRVTVPERGSAWVLPVAIGGGVLVAGGAIALAVILGGKSNPPNAKVNIGVMHFPLP
jgi:hypothetical protein